MSGSPEAESVSPEAFDPVRVLDQVLEYLSPENCGPMLGCEDPESGVHLIVADIQKIRAWCLFAQDVASDTQDRVVELEAALQGRTVSCVCGGGAQLREAEVNAEQGVLVAKDLEKRLVAERIARMQLMAELVSAKASLVEAAAFARGVVGGCQCLTCGPAHRLAERWEHQARSEGADVVARALAEEREACAGMVEEVSLGTYRERMERKRVAAAIRARGAT